MNPANQAAATPPGSQIKQANQPIATASKPIRFPSNPDMTVTPLPKETVLSASIELPLTKETVLSASIELPLTAPRDITSQEKADITIIQKPPKKDPSDPVGNRKDQTTSGPREVQPTDRQGQRAMQALSKFIEKEADILPSHKYGMILYNPYYAKKIKTLNPMMAFIYASRIVAGLNLSQLKTEKAYHKLRAEKCERAGLYGKVTEPSEDWSAAARKKAAEEAGKKAAALQGAVKKTNKRGQGVEADKAKPNLDDADYIGLEIARHLAARGDPFYLAHPDLRRDPDEPIPWDCRDDKQHDETLMDMGKIEVSWIEFMSGLESQTYVTGGKRSMIGLESYHSVPWWDNPNLSKRLQAKKHFRRKFERKAFDTKPKRHARAVTSIQQGLRQARRIEDVEKTCDCHIYRSLSSLEPYNPEIFGPGGWDGRSYLNPTRMDKEKPTIDIYINKIERAKDPETGEEYVSRVHLGMAGTNTWGYLGPDDVGECKICDRAMGNKDIKHTSAYQLKVDNFYIWAHGDFCPKFGKDPLEMHGKCPHNPTTHGPEAPWSNVIPSLTWAHTTEWGLVVRLLCSVENLDNLYDSAKAHRLLEDGERVQPMQGCFDTALKSEPSEKEMYWQKVMTCDLPLPADIGQGDALYAPELSKKARFEHQKRRRREVYLKDRDGEVFSTIRHNAVRRGHWERFLVGSWKKYIRREVQRLMHSDEWKQVCHRQVWNLSDDSQQLMISTHFQPTYEKDNYLLRGPPLPNLNGGWPKPKPHIRGEKRTMPEWEERDEQEVVDSDRLAEELLKRFREDQAFGNEVIKKGAKMLERIIFNRILFEIAHDRMAFMNNFGKRMDPDEEMAAQGTRH